MLNLYVLFHNILFLLPAFTTVSLRLSTNANKDSNFTNYTAMPCGFEGKINEKTIVAYDCETNSLI